MESLDSRLRSFAKPKGKSASRAWPHPDSHVANPTSLAEAGFYFKPSKDDPDNVRCFICKKELGGWDEDDNPFEIHVNKCPKCPWAIARCSLEFDVDSKGNFSIKDPARVPTNKTLEKARADTFGGKKWWPHDAVKTHGATSKKMAKAGFVYTPQVEGDDTATCFYCDLSLSGWDEEDDPTEEHLKRVERSGKPCPFFQSTEPQASTRSRSTKSTSRKSRAPKHADALSDDDEETPPVILEPTKKAPSSNGASSLGRSTKHSEDSEELEEDDDPSLKVKPVPGPRKSSKKPGSKSKPPSKATSKSKSRMTVVSEDPEPTRSRSRSGKKGDQAEKEKQDKPPSNVDGKITKPYKDFAVVIDVPKAKDNGGKDASRGRSRSKSKPRSTDDAQSKPLLRTASRSRVSGITEAEDERETEEMLAVPPSDAEQQPEKETKKKPRSKARKRTKKTQANLDVREATAPSSSAVSDNLTSQGEQKNEEEVELRPKGQRMNVDGDVVAPEREETAEQAFPTPASPSDFKATKTSLLPSADDSRREEHKSASRAGGRMEKAANDMEVQDDAVPELQSSRPTTPENQIIPKANAEAMDFEQSLEVPPSPVDLFLPPLARLPVQVVAALTVAERAMSVEEWIRHEMGVQYARLKEDGERRIEAFLERAAETRRQIEAL